ncbi:MAG: hypothetical protein GF315_09780 [candidate division Zixibacteria bacterium]|nr:hypothetical protein [candidate division Zixibacteria bacterium]
MNSKDIIELIERKAIPTYQPAIIIKEKDWQKIKEKALDNEIEGVK